MNSSERIEELVRDNQGLVYYIVKSMGIEQGSLEYADIISAGMIGLLKAASTFEELKKIKFSTYATVCIKNEIFMYERTFKKSSKNISLEGLIAINGDGDELVLGDVIGDTKSNFVEKILINDEVIGSINVLLNCLEGKNRISMLYKLGEKTQIEIAKKLGRLIKVAMSVFVFYFLAH